MYRKKKCFTALFLACLMLVMTFAPAGLTQAYIWPDRTLIYGLTGEDVLSLQTALRDQGYEVGELDGVFGAMTENAVIQFQTDQDLYVDGIAGNMTLTALYGAADGTVPPQQEAEPAEEPADTPVEVQTAAASDTGSFSRNLSAGMSGSDVLTLQTMLMEHGFYDGAIDGDFGNYTKNAVIAFQTSRGLYPDGIAGPVTFAALTGTQPENTAASSNTANTADASDTEAADDNAPSGGISFDRQLSVGMDGSDVHALQTILRNLGYYSGAIDGDFGAMTEASVMAFQAEKGLHVDGLAGPVTFEALRLASTAGVSAQTPQTAAEPVTEAEPQTQARPQTEAEPETEAKPQTEAEPQTEAKPQTAAPAAADTGTPAAAGPVLSSICNAPGGLRIGWEKTAGAAAYRVLRLSGDGSWQTIADTSELHYIDQSVVSGNYYTYTVRALAADGSYAGNYDQTGISFTYTYDYDALLAAAPASVTKEDLMTMGKQLGMDSYEIKALIGWVEGEGYTNIGDPYMAYLSACVVLNGILDGIHGRGRDLVARITTWGSYYSPNAQENRYENASSSTLLAVYLAMMQRPAGIYFCRGANSMPENCFYDAGFDVQGQHVYVW